MRRWVPALLVLGSLVASGCESLYEVRGFVYAMKVEGGFVEVAKDGEPTPAGSSPVENATVALTTYTRGELAGEWPADEYYSSSEGEFRFELPETLLEMLGRLLLGMRTKFQLTCRRTEYEKVMADVELPPGHKRHLRIFLKEIPPAGP
jgi:hypothetical protein